MTFVSVLLSISSIAGCVLIPDDDGKKENPASAADFFPLEKAYTLKYSYYAEITPEGGATTVHQGTALFELTPPLPDDTTGVRATATLTVQAPGYDTTTTTASYYYIENNAVIVEDIPTLPASRVQTQSLLMKPSAFMERIDRHGQAAVLYDFNDDEIWTVVEWRDGNGNSETYKGVFSGFEDMETDAGLFRQCAKFRFDYVLVYGDVTTKGNVTTWLAQGVGVVRDEIIWSSEDGSSGMGEYEIR